MHSSIANSKEIIGKLQEDILLMEGYRPMVPGSYHISGLEGIEAAFPNKIFPVAAIHEFMSIKTEHTAATAGFIGGILASLVQQAGICLWVSTNRWLFAAALNAFKVIPDNIIFIFAERERDVLWAAEEGLKCKGIAAVIAEVSCLTFMQSRRLQLAVEASKATGFIVRGDGYKPSPTICTALWQIRSQPSQTEPGLPGVGFPCWQVELLKVRNGKPGKWIVEWSANGFSIVTEQQRSQIIQTEIRKAG